MTRVIYHTQSCFQTKLFDFFDTAIIIFSTAFKIREIIVNYLIYKFWEESVNINNRQQKHLLNNVLEKFVDGSIFENRITMFYPDLSSKIYFIPVKALIFQ